MVVHAFPAAKLGALILKQISKPIANAVKQKAKSSPVFRKYVCLPPAQFYNWCEVKGKMWVLALGKPVNISVMNEEMAIELGANLLGEGVIFLIAAGILVAEYSRSSRKEAAKEEQKLKEMADLQRTIVELFMQTEEQAAHIRELSRKLGDLETRVVQKPWVPKKGTDDTTPPPPRQPPPFVAPSQDSEPAKDGSTQDENSSDPDSSNIVKNCKYEDTKYPSHGLVAKAVSDVEHQFWFDSDGRREKGIITVALNQLYKDVYRTSLTF